MTNFIEVTDPKGMKIILNTEYIVSVSVVDVSYSVEYSGDNNFKYVPQCCIVVQLGDNDLDEWYVLETYDEMLDMLMQK